LDFLFTGKDFKRFLERQATKAQTIEAGQNEGDQVTET